MNEQGASPWRLALRQALEHCRELPNRELLLRGWLRGWSPTFSGDLNYALLRSLRCE